MIRFDLQYISPDVKSLTRYIGKPDQGEQDVLIISFPSGDLREVLW